MLNPTAVVSPIKSLPLLITYIVWVVPLEGKLITPVAGPLLTPITAPEPLLKVTAWFCLNGWLGT